MNEKERIIELVKQNIISMEEALDLLEAAGKSTDSNLNEEISQAEEKQPKALHEDEELNNLYENYTSLEKELDKINEKLVINQQRQREINILGELDDLSEDMQTQRDKLEAERLSLLEEKYRVEDQLETLNEKKSSLKEDIEEMISNFSLEDSVETAREFGSQLQSEGAKIGRSLSESFGNFMKNFDFKDISIDFSIPGLKKQKFDHCFEFPLAEIEYLDIASKNGDIQVCSNDEDQIVIEANATFYGRHENYDLNRLEELCEIISDDKKLIFKVHGDRVRVDLKVSLPEKVYNFGQFESRNGDLTLKEVAFSDLNINSVNGDISLEDVRATQSKVEMVNGDFVYNDSEIADITVNNVNGDIRLKGNLEDVALKSVNSDFFITKENAASGEIKMKTTNGDVKIAFPETMNLKSELETNLGDIRDLINMTYTSLSKHKKEGLLEVSEDAPMLTLQVSTRTGDIFIKHNETKID